jgi:glutaredoxin
MIVQSDTTQHPGIGIYWLPSCANCVRLKEHVTKRGFQFESVNVQAEPARMVELEVRGIRGLPVITRGDRHAFGLDLDRIDEILGIDDTTRKLISPGELVDRINRVADAGIRLGRQLPAARYNDKIPGRNRSYLGLVAHIAGHLSRFVTVIQQPGLNYTDVEAYALAGGQSYHRDLEEDGLTVETIAQRIAAGSAAARRWLDTPTPPADHVIQMFYGPATVHGILASNTYSVVQHTRQLQAVVRYLGYEPDAPIGEAEFQNLLIPVALWEEVA